ncbi:hypothetical protein R6Q57_025242 [Mikania cordata]
MGKKGSSKKGPATTSGPQMSITMREASTGKKQTNVKSALKLQHIKNLALWASRDANIPSLGAYFGHRLAASSEAFGALLDRSLFICQRCESILHPDYNCTIRTKKNKKNARHKGKKITNRPQNNTVYTCHFCSHRNMKRGNPINTSQPKVKPSPKSNNLKTSNTVSSSGMTKDNIIAKAIAAPLGSTSDEPHGGKMDIVEINQALKVKDKSFDTLEVKDGSNASGPATPLTATTLTLLESKMKRRNRSGSKKKVTPEAENSPIAEKSSNRRKRKSWTSLKEIAEQNENEKRKKLMDLIVPFSMQ